MRQLVILCISISVLVDEALSQTNIDTTKNDRFSIHAQATVVNQFKPAFNANYSGPNSLQTQMEDQLSITTTLFAGIRLWKGASFFGNVEVAGGSGLSSALGVASAPNGETFRVGSPTPAVYLARLYYRQLIGLNKKRIYQERDLNQLGENIPTNYLAFTIGQVSIADYFDHNTYSHDPRTQFMSWGLMSNGAYDYPANTRGYTPSVVLEFVTPRHELRYAMSMVATTANGSEFNYNIGKASSHVLEYTFRYKLFKRNGVLRLLSFITTANMGNYLQSIWQSPANPNIVNTRTFGNIKYGFGLNFEQEITSYMGCFFRASWNDGNNETWAFTEIDHSLSLGLSVNGEKWKRKNDNVAIAYVISGISQPHRNYLAAGGSGFMLGDGKLRYAPEHLWEFYYSASILKENIFLSGGYQLILNPGYNYDRQGPVNVFSIRFHARI